MDEVLIEGFLKNSTTMIGGLINEYQGRRLIHLREMTPAASGSGEWVHGRGIALPADRAGELAGAVRKLTQVAASEAVVERLALDGDEVWVGVQLFKNLQYAYVRRYFAPRKGSTEWLPSKKGISARVTLIDDLVVLTDQIEARVKELGLDV